jgi:hypothetical protein
VICDKHLSKLFPSEDVELVFSSPVDLDEYHHQVLGRTILIFTNYLLRTYEFYLTEITDISELRRITYARLNLNRDMISSLISSDNIVMGDVACERGADPPTTRELCGNEIFASLTCYFVVSTSGHTCAGSNKTPAITMVPLASQ